MERTHKVSVVLHKQASGQTLSLSCALARTHVQLGAAEVLADLKLLD